MAAAFAIGFVIEFKAFNTVSTATAIAITTEASV